MKKFTNKSMNKVPLLLVSVSVSVSVLVLMLAFNKVFAHNHTEKSNSEHNAQNRNKQCEPEDITCAKTVTSAFDPQGKLWRIWSGGDHLFFSISKDNGQHFGSPVKVNIKPEKISARNENRPKLAFDDKNNVYISWAKPLKKQYTSEIRFTYSTDGGKHFAPAQTVNNDSFETGHSFNEMLVNGDGQVVLTWLDARESKNNPNYQGSALYAAQGKLTEKGFSFDNRKLADGTCVCCRIAMTHSANNKIAAMWRHIYDDNIRDHAILTFDQKNIPAQPFRASFDQWHINGCPHQGPGLSINEQNRYHMVWFNNGEKGKGIFYAYSDDSGKNKSIPLKIGDTEKQASYAHVISNDNIVEVVWIQFNGKTYQLYHQRSRDNGKTFGHPSMIGESAQDPDRPFLIKHERQNFVSWHRPDLGHQVISL